MTVPFPNPDLLVFLSADAGRMVILKTGFWDVCNLHSSPLGRKTA